MSMSIYIGALLHSASNALNAPNTAKTSGLQ